MEVPGEQGSVPTHDSTEEYRSDAAGPSVEAGRDMTGQGAQSSESQQATAQDGTNVLERMTRADVERALADGQSLRNKDLSGLDLSSLTFADQDLTGSDLSWTQNVNTTYERVEAVGASFANAFFKDSTLEEIAGSKSDWNSATLENTDIRRSNFSHASWVNAVVRSVQERTSEIPQLPAVERQEAGNTTLPATERDRSGEATPAPGSKSQGPLGAVLRERQPPLEFRAVVESAKAWWAGKKASANDTFNKAVAAVVGLPSATQEHRINTERVEALERAMYAAGWDGQGGASRAVAEKEIERRWDALIKSGQFSVADVHLGVPLFNQIAQELNQPATGPELTDNLPSPIPDIARPAEIADNNFQFADMRGVVFQGVAVRNNDFENADIRGVIFTPAEQLENTFSETDLVAARDAEAKAHHAALDELGVFDSKVN